MKQRSALCVLALMILGASMLVSQVGHTASNQRVITYVAKYGAAGDTTAAGLRKTYDGGPEDSVAGTPAVNTDWIPILGAREVYIYVRDSSYSGTGVYTDSLGAFFFELSNDKSNYVALNANSVSITDDDSVKVTYWGKMIGLGLSGQSGVKSGGYLLGHIVPDNVEDFDFYMQYQWIRFGFQPTARPRNPTSTELASVLGVRILVRVFYDGINDSYVSPGED